VTAPAKTTENVNPYDRSAKVLFQKRPLDFLRLVLPDLQAGQIRIENPELNIAERRADHVCILDERTAAAVEFMIEPDPRELRSFFTKAGMLAAALDRDVLLLVYYLTAGGYANLPAEYRVSHGPLEQGYRFTAIPLWEHAAAIHAGQLRALVPFLSLWTDEAHLKAETLATVRQLALQEPDMRIRQDLLSIAVTVAGRTIHDKKWLLEFFREEWTMIKESTIVDDWIQEGVQKGLQQGLQQGIQKGLQQGMQQGLQQGMQQGMQQRLDATRNHVLNILTIRFELVPADVIATLGQISQVGILDQLVGLAVKVTDLDQFRQKLKLIGA
jgi:hypothetical protein